MRRMMAWLVVLALLMPVTALAKKKDKEAAAEEPETKLEASTFAGLGLREIGPGIASGRIGDLAVDPNNPKRYFVAVASGGVWKTENAGTTFEPIFDNEGSYSIGCVTLDPNDPFTVWVGTGENNSQRSVAYGDGVYKSVDGGKSWKNMGLGESEHIAKIVVDPRDSNVVYVASQGPLWSSGGDRGLYKTTDGGETWEMILNSEEHAEHTGVTDLVMDPRNPDVLYAATYQRRRRVWTLINGGPGSGLHKSTDGGETWTQLSNGLPGGEVGRIGLAIAPSDPDVVYAMIEAEDDAGGFFRSTDRGASWTKRNPYFSGSPQYYQEIFVDPHDAGRVYSMDTWMMVTEDGGASFQLVGEYHKHVDNHALWIDPDDTDHLLAGCDGGIYQTWDRGETWDFLPNLPVTQFYKVAVDNDTPFYNVYGGTQDNFTIGGPSRTKNQHGITNREWFIVLGGDGFEPQIDPENPDIIYAQLQYGNLHRYDRKNGELIDIQPQAAPGEDPLRWNWDAALLISPHSNTRLYYTAQRVFRSDDRGNSWTPISGDLTRQIDRNQLEVMGKVWSVDAVAKNRSTSPYGNIVAFSESARVEGLLYAGTDDGLVQVREPGSEEWRQIDSFPGVPDYSYVDHLEASLHDDDTVYALFNDHKSGNFAPYALKSTDRGQTWTSITGDLPERGSLYGFAQDHENPNLLFAGSEFGVYFTLDGGERWIELTGGLPTIAVRDLDIQRRENDLVLATFGRGFWILDDYTPLRHIDAEKLEEEALLFPVKDAWAYMEAFPLGLRGNAHQGDRFYAAKNPPFGAVFTYYLKDSPKSLADQRREAEKEAGEAGEPTPQPTWDALRAEDREGSTEVVLTVRDSEGHVVRRLTGPASAGFHRVAWDLHHPGPQPVSLEPFDWHNPFQDLPRGPAAVPGDYTVSLAIRSSGETRELGEPQSFSMVPLGAATLPAEDREALNAFQQQTSRLSRAVSAAVAIVGDAQHRMTLLAHAIDATPSATPDHRSRLRALELRLTDLREALTGDATVARRSEPIPPTIQGRVDRIIYGHWRSTSAPTQTQRDSYRHAAEAFGPVLGQLETLVETDLAGLEAELEAAGAPWTPGRFPEWTME